MHSLLYYFVLICIPSYNGTIACSSTIPKVDLAKTVQN
jgi:hypothetical protein